MQYVVVAVATDGRRFKLNKGRIERQTSARADDPAEDRHGTPFDAIHAATAALRAWLYQPEGLRVTVEPREPMHEAQDD